MNYGLLTFVPIIVVIALALKTRKTLFSLIIGTLLCYIIISGVGFYEGWTDAIFRAACKQTNQWVFLVCMLFGSLIALLGASHGTLGFSRLLERFCVGPKSTLIVTWIMGVIIFIDDYLNIMTLSVCMKKLSDKNRIPREALSYVIDSTGAPVCAILPLSTWAVFFSELFYDNAGIKALGYGGPMQTFFHVIPVSFYAIFAIAIVPLFALGLAPKMGRMRRAYERVKKTGKVYSPESGMLNAEEESSESIDVNLKGNILDFIIPIGVLIASAIAVGDLFISVLAAIFACFVLYVPRKKISFQRFCDLAMYGFSNMVPTVAIIFFAFVMQEAMGDIRIANYLIEMVSPYASAALLPAIAFVVVAALNFSTSSVWGIPAIVTPIILPLAFKIGADPVLVMGAIVSGATFGSHACFYSDATVLTSSCCKMENMDHALSQFPYSLLAAGLALVGYVACGFIMT